MQSDGLQYYTGEVASRAGVSERADFLTKTYMHLAGAVAAFILVETALQQMGVGKAITGMLTGQFSWLIVLGLFMVVCHVAQRMAESNTAKGVAYAGLGLFIVAEAVIFAPLLWIAAEFYTGVIFDAALITVAIFTALTVAVLVTRKDFSFLGTALRFAGFAAIGLILAAIFLGFSLGTWFSIGMILFMAAAILYQTSNVLHHYRTDQYVPAALALFASLATMFWYVLRLFMSRD